MTNDPGADRARGLAEVRREEQRVEERSAPFRKELGLTDLVLTQIVFVVGAALFIAGRRRQRAAATAL